MWSELLEDGEKLQLYSIAMHRLATGHWLTAVGHEASRITWCVEACEWYYGGGCGLQKLLLKDLRRVAHGMPTLVTSDLLPGSEGHVMSVVEGVASGGWDMLDVGSCFNPFSAFQQFTVTAVDIAPADEVGVTGGVKVWSCNRW